MSAWNSAGVVDLEPHLFTLDDPLSSTYQPRFITHWLNSFFRLAQLPIRYHSTLDNLPLPTFN